MSTLGGFRHERVVVGIAALAMAVCVACNGPGEPEQPANAIDEAKLLTQEAFPPGYSVRPNNETSQDKARSLSELVTGQESDNPACVQATSDQVPVVAASERVGIVAVAPERPHDERYSESLVIDGPTLDDQRALAETCRETTTEVPGVGKAIETYGVLPAPPEVIAEDSVVIVIDVTTDPLPASGEIPSRRQTVVGYAQVGSLQVEFYQEVDGFQATPDFQEFNALFAEAVRRVSDVA
ncbi:hypothetical protein V1Y59_13745 [Gordonia sp. PKS22-38]|uniref:DUF5642 domain-containing protein n=1 Tax=Gordonia prachuapensis TaxID=3115651 RepID=A0ABU7MV75_9ACTN|nr:hypothetical protein [Gordonia sp. PKS22-38]